MPCSKRLVGIRYDFGATVLRYMKKTSNSRKRKRWAVREKNRLGRHFSLDSSIRSWFKAMEGYGLSGSIYLSDVHRFTCTCHGRGVTLIRARGESWEAYFWGADWVMALDEEDLKKFLFRYLIQGLL